MNTTIENNDSHSENPSVGTVDQHSIVKRRPRFWWFMFYLLPIILVLVAGSLIQRWVVDSCAEIPVGLRGECGAGWLQILFIPATYIATLIGCLVAAAGVIHFAIYCTSIYRETNKSLTVILGVLMSIFVLIGGFFLAIGVIF